jgi:hypothetical protein
MHVLIVLVAAAVVASLHAVLPDHWVPISVVARANGWSLRRTAKTSVWAAGGHVLSSLVIGAVIIALGTGVKSFVALQGKLIGVVLLVTGVGLLAWALWQKRSGHGHHHGHGHPHHHAVPGEHSHDHGHPHVHEHEDHEHPHPHDHPHEGHEHDHPDDHPHDHVHPHDHAHADEHEHPHPHDPAPDPGISEAAGTQPARRGWAAALAVPFGVAASPDLTILPVFLAASAISLAASVAVVVVFSLVTLGTFVGLTVAATAGGYRVEWPWLEANAEVVSSAVLIVLGVAAYLAL